MNLDSEKLNEVLRGLRLSSPEIIGATVVNSDGFTIASVVPTEIDQDLVSAMARSLLGVGGRISTDLMRSSMEQAFVRSPKGYVIVNAIGEDASLVLLVAREAKLGLIFLELERTSAELANQMS